MQLRCSKCCAFAAIPAELQRNAAHCAGFLRELRSLIQLRCLRSKASLRDASECFAFARKAELCAAKRSAFSGASHRPLLRNGAFAKQKHTVASQRGFAKQNELSGAKLRTGGKQGFALRSPSGCGLRPIKKRTLRNFERIGAAEVGQIPKIMKIRTNRAAYCGKKQLKSGFQGGYPSFAADFRWLWQIGIRIFFTKPRILGLKKNILS